MTNESKPIIYQLFPRIFTNRCPEPVAGGKIEQNGSGKMNDISGTALRKLRELGVTHVWYTGVIRHAQKTDYSAHGIPACNPHVVKGEAGSPYAITDYYDIDPDIAADVDRRQEEFDALVERTHKAGLKVVLDFVPNHVARQYHSIARPADVAELGVDDDRSTAFARDNNFYWLPGEQFAPQIPLGEGEEFYYEKPAMATGNDCFHPYPTAGDWYETVKLNYGIDYRDGSRHFSPTPSTWHKMLHVMLYWCSRGVDALRCDMVHMVPVEFWNWAIPQVKAAHPGTVFIAELYDTGIYRDYIFRGHFDYLYDKVSLYDTLFAVTRGTAPAAAITQCWQTVEGVGDHMLHFLENHDELRIASEQFAGDPWHGIPALVVSATMSRAPFMLYYGQELGEPAADAEGFSGRDGKTTIFDFWSVDTLRRWCNGGKFNTSLLTAGEKLLRRTYTKILNLAGSEAAIAHGGFYDLMYVNYGTLNADKIYTYYRHHGAERLLIAVNFGDSEERPHIFTPAHAFEVMNMEQGEYHATELLSGKALTLRLNVHEPVALTIPAHGAMIIKF